MYFKIKNLRSCHIYDFMSEYWIGNIVILCIVEFICLVHKIKLEGGNILHINDFIDKVNEFELIKANIIHLNLFKLYLHTKKNK